MPIPNTFLTPKHNIQHRQWLSHDTPPSSPTPLNSSSPAQTITPSSCGHPSPPLAQEHVNPSHDSPDTSARSPTSLSAQTAAGTRVGGTNRTVRSHTPWTRRSRVPSRMVGRFASPREREQRQHSQSNVHRPPLAHLMCNGYS
jgi:hypothetical protein